MQKQRREITHREASICNPQLSEKVRAKQPFNFYRKGLAGQQSAHRPTRMPQRSLLTSQQGTLTIPEESIRNSSIYHLLQEQMKAMASKHLIQMTRLKQTKQQKERQAKRVKQEQFSTKMQIWQLKNEVMEIKESIKTEKEEMARLQEDLGLDSDRETSALPPTD